MSTKYTPELEEQAVALYLKSSTKIGRAHV